jgi:TolA-binding protein
MKILVKSLFCSFFLANIAFADDLSQFNTQIQSQLKQLQTTQEQQTQQVNSQLQDQIKKVQSDLQQQMQTMNTQLQNQIKQVQSQLQTQIQTVNSQVQQLQAGKLAPAPAPGK